MPGVLCYLQRKRFMTDQACPQFLQHKTSFPDPAYLNEKLIERLHKRNEAFTKSPVVYAEQYPGQIIVTDIQAYHWVVHSGFASMKHVMS